MTEDQFYRSLFPRLRWDAERVAIPPGDDCAAVRARGTELLLVAVDQVVGNRHYRTQGPEAAPADRVGRKLLARNLSDIAAMGGTPEYAVVSVALGPGCSLQWLDAFMDGLLALARDFGVAVIGGDVARAPQDDVGSLTILGRVEQAEALRRGGARAGDLLYATGCFGASLATGHHLSFTPRCKEGRWLAEQRWPTAMIDVSDGLLLDARRLADASKMTLQLIPERIPPRVASLPTERVLADGEDYELLFSLPKEQGAALESNWPFSEVPLTRVGSVTQQRTHAVTDPGGAPLDSGVQGYDHFMQA